MNDKVHEYGGGRAEGKTESLTQTRPGAEFFWAPPKGAKILGMQSLFGVIVVATEDGVYTIGSTPAFRENVTVEKITWKF